MSFSEYNSGQILKLESGIFLMMYSLSRYNIKSDSNFELYINKTASVRPRSGNG